MVIPLIGVFIQSISVAQLVVNDDVTAEDLATALLGSGVSISGIELNCPDGAYGLFECIDCNAGIPNGIVLTSGDVFVAEGPNTGTSDTGAWSAPGDDDLDAISGYTTYDACILEFDVTVTSDTLKFNYVFGSEEYTTYVNSSVNDAFGLFISGPGITGLENLALIPTTTIGISINTVNPLEYDEYYIDNGVGCTPSWGGCTEGPLGAPYTTDDYYIGYDGFTVVMEAKRSVIPCETYHLKLAIADAGDGVLDSGVFIEAGSLTSPGIVVDVEPEIEGYPYLIEGCVNGSFNVNLSFAPIDTFVTYFLLGGKATTRLDYTALPDSVVFLPGEISASFPVTIFSDGLAEGMETIVIALEFGCTSDLSDSIIVEIYDNIPLTVTPIDTTVCAGTGAVLTAAGGLTYSWSPAGTLSDPYSAVTTATPVSSTVYTVTTTVGTCTKSVNVPVNVSPGPTIVTSGDDAICVGDEITITAAGGVVYSWSPASSLSNPNISNPIADPTSTTTYTVVVTDPYGCQNDAELTIYVNPLPIVNAGPNILVCYGEQVELFATGGVSYFWVPADNLNNPNIANPILTVVETTPLTVTVTDANGCQNTANVLVELDPVPVAYAGMDTIIYLGESAFLNGIGGGDFSWSPEDPLSNPNSLNTLATPQETTAFVLSVLSEAGCFSSDTVVVYVTNVPLVVFPTAFTPNNDGFNDFFSPFSRGDIAQFEFSIYNRWGEIVYTTSDPAVLGASQGRGWDGTLNGEVQPLGAYVYLMTLTDLVGKGYTYSGSFTLVR
ncbi:MAG: choice-of-anchor L domain-containing protein [Chitinophagales bacterium]